MIKFDNIALSRVKDHCVTTQVELSSKLLQPVKIFALGVVLIGLPACAMSSGLKSVATENTVVNQSISKQTEPEGIATADAELIKSVVADANTGSSPSVLAWSNPDTGNKGTITAIDKFTGSHGQKCRKFQTTVDTFMGISLYNGETCELKRGLWVLSWFLREGA